MSSNNQIKCPQCSFEFNVQDILSSQAEEELKKKYSALIAQEKQKFEKDAEQLQKQREEFEAKKKRENELFMERVAAGMKEEKRNLEEKLKKEIQHEQAEALAKLRADLDEKSKQVSELNKTKVEVEQLKREKLELKDAIEAEAARNLNKQIQEEKEKIRKSEEEKNELRIKELLKQLEDQKKLTEEMKRKQEQGSMQLQGEVMELAIEEWLSAQFPLDTIEEIKKGARGGDCIQIVNTYSQQNCGSIYYESKRTKEFQPGWIEKFKADIRIKGANIGVLVTDAMPANMDRMGLRDGIWICNFEEFKGLCAVLRESIIQLSAAVLSQENKGDKMHMLYDYLTSNTFHMQVEAIVEGFKSLREDLESEKRSMHNIWKKREKQIEKVQLNTIDMYASVRGIAGSAVQRVQALELPDNQESLTEGEA